MSSRALQQSVQSVGGSALPVDRSGQRGHRAFDADGDVLTLDELATWLRLDGTATPRRNAWRYLRRNQVPVIRDGRKVLVRLRDVQAQRRDDTVTRERRRKVIAHA